MSKEEFKVSNMFIDSLKTQQELYYKAKIEKIYQQKLKDLQQKVEQLEKELTLMVEDDERSQETIIKQSKRIKQLENIRKEAIEELSYMSTDVYVEDYDIREKHYNLLMNILNKGDNK